MWSIVRENPVAVIFAVVLHIVFAGILIFSLNYSAPNIVVSPDAKIIKATVIDEGKIKKQREHKKSLERQKERDRKKRLEKKKAEEKRKLDLKKKKEADKKRIALKKKKAEAKRKLDLKKKREAAELKKKEDADRKAREAEFKKQIEAENARLEKEAKRAGQQKEVDKYQALIKQAISNKWRIPVSARQGQECVLKLRLIPSGDVVSVEIIKSSGDAVFDRSVESAVHKASPLPLPPAESALFGEFREIKMPFRLDKKN